MAENGCPSTRCGKHTENEQGIERDEAIVAIIEDAAYERDRVNIVILGGDFNELSHLDWIEETKYLYDHNRVIVPWNCSVSLTKFGFKDAYREMFPDPVIHPGFRIISIC